MKIAHFFTTEYCGQCFDSYADLQAAELECGGGFGQHMEYWQTEDGRIFESAAEAGQYVRDNAASSFDWDGFNMKGIELLGLFPS